MCVHLHCIWRVIFMRIATCITWSLRDWRASWLLNCFHFCCNFYYSKIDIWKYMWVKFYFTHSTQLKLSLYSVEGLQCRKWGHNASQTNTSDSVVVDSGNTYNVWPIMYPQYNRIRDQHVSCSNNAFRIIHPIGIYTHNAGVPGRSIKHPIAMYIHNAFRSIHQMAIYLLTYLLHCAESFLSSWLTCS